MQKSMLIQPTPKQLRKSIKLDRVNPADFLHKNMIYACEDCSHFDPTSSTCTIGYRAELHKRDIQLQRFYSNSHMAFCRCMEID